MFYEPLPKAEVFEPPPPRGRLACGSDFSFVLRLPLNTKDQNKPGGPSIGPPPPRNEKPQDQDEPPEAK
jgi:hypothetical protein